jgi:dTDP-4-amino-4,6-dideoxygalactose transaminase
VDAVPLFVDIQPVTWTLSVAAVRRLLSERDDLRGHIKAVMLVHLYGMMAADMADLVELAGEEVWKVIEVTSQAHGATLQVDGDTYVAGTMSDDGTFSMTGRKKMRALPKTGAAL